MEQQMCIFLSLPLAATVPVEVFPLNLHFPVWFQLQLSFGFPNTSPACSSNVSVFRLGSPSVLLLAVHFLFVLELSWESLVHPYWPPATLA